MHCFARALRASVLCTACPEPCPGLWKLSRVARSREICIHRFYFLPTWFDIPTTLMGPEVVTGIEDNGLCVAVSHELKYSQLRPPFADVDVSGHMIIQTFLFFFKEWWLWKETIVLNSPSRSCCGDLALETSFPVSLSPITAAQSLFSTYSSGLCYTLARSLCVQDFIHHVNSYCSAPSSKMKTASGHFIMSLLQHVSSVLPSQRQTERIRGWLSSTYPHHHVLITGVGKWKGKTM